jgi:hypothetical protein
MPYLGQSPLLQMMTLLGREFLKRYFVMLATLSLIHNVEMVLYFRTIKNEICNNRKQFFSIIVGKPIMLEQNTDKIVKCIKRKTANILMPDPHLSGL